jgi:hypothetical protein
VDPASIKSCALLLTSTDTVTSLVVVLETTPATSLVDGERHEISVEDTYSASTRVVPPKRHTRVPEFTKFVPTIAMVVPPTSGPVLGAIERRCDGAKYANFDVEAPLCSISLESVMDE